MQEIILTAALAVVFLMVFVILIRWFNLHCQGPLAVPLFTFIAILFTSGLDVGLIMFPLTEFPEYTNLTKNPEYGFTHALAIEFGFWGFLIWAFYFLTSFYFCIIEPKVRFFEIHWVKFVNNVIIIGTCAFTGFLLLENLSWYLPNQSSLLYYAITLIVVLSSVLSSTRLVYIKILSTASTWLFILLIAVMFSNLLLSGVSIGQFTGEMGNLLTGYFSNIHRFAFPINDYHAFYLFWWFAWSIMIGQFVARFVSGLKTYQLLLALLVIPSIPIAVWFTVLYLHYSQHIQINATLNLAMVILGIVFVLNSLDSLIRLYTSNLNLTVERLGRVQYIVMNFVFLSGLVFAFKFTPLEIQWVGLVVIGLYAAVLFYLLAYQRKVVVEIA